jgi:hypothetical protein
VASSETLKWPTIIHECLHGFSAGYDPKRDADLEAWEEGVIELLQRALRQRVLHEIGVQLPESAFAARDEGHLYNRFLGELERSRNQLGMEAEEFYLELLRMPFQERAPHVMGRVIRKLRGDP